MQNEDTMNVLENGGKELDGEHLGLMPAATNLMPTEAAAVRPLHAGDAAVAGDGGG